MNKLFKFKEWLTIPEAAKQLSNVLEDDNVSEADILELGLNRHLKISLHIPHHAYACRGKRLPLSLATKVDFSLFKEIMLSKRSPEEAIEHEPKIPEWIYTGIRTGEDEVVEFDRKIESISGTWDLLMWGGERLYVEKMFYALKSDTYLDLMNIDGSFLQTYDEEVVFSLQEYYGDFSDYPKEDLINPRSHPNNYCPMDGIPPDSFLVVRTDALRDFELKIKNSYPENQLQQSTEKQLAAKTENSYLRLIQALAEYATDGLTGKPNKDAGTILAALNSKGIDCPVGDKTLAGYLEKAQQISK